MNLQASLRAKRGSPCIDWLVAALLAITREKFATTVGNVMIYEALAQYGYPLVLPVDCVPGSDCVAARRCIKRSHCAS